MSSSSSSRPQYVVITSVLLGLAAAWCAAAAGCEAVPDIRFVTDDGSADAPDSPRDGPGADSNVPSDAGPCGPAPFNGGTCCGTVWCFDMCDTASCNECAAKGCGPGDVCCGKNGTVLCKRGCP